MIHTEYRVQCASFRFEIKFEIDTRPVFRIKPDFTLYTKYISIGIPQFFFWHCPTEKYIYLANKTHSHEDSTKLNTNIYEFQKSYSKISHSLCLFVLCTLHTRAHTHNKYCACVNTHEMLKAVVPERNLVT